MNKKIIVNILVAALLHASLAPLSFACFREGSKAADGGGSCPTCPAPCGGNVTSHPAYKFCEGVGTGSPGRCECASTNQQIATNYGCYTDVNWTRMTICIAGAPGCALLCAGCVGVLTCSKCIACVGSILAGCEDCDVYECVKETTGYPVYRKIFSALSGDSCEGK